MRIDSPHTYQLYLESKLLGPYSRRTIVGMRIKGLVDLSAIVKRSDGYEMSVAQLMADRFEMADAQSLQRQAAHPPSSGFWPAFVTHFGGNLFKPGAFGFIGEGEVRFQGDTLRITAKRKVSMLQKETERIKIPLLSISRARQNAMQRKCIFLYPQPGQAFEGCDIQEVVQLELGDEDSAAELIELMNLPPPSKF